MTESDKSNASRVVLIRHAEPVFDMAEPPANWRLSPKGRTDSVDLARRLGALSLSRLISSTEPKAVETAVIIAQDLGVPTSTDHRLGEVRRPWVKDGFARLVAQYLAGSVLPEWEPFSEVQGRMNGAIDEIARDGLTGVVSHGTALTAWLATRVTLRAEDFWNDLRLPDAWLVEGAGLTRL